eukprot:9163597-Alexandrium_andersonii.AAC.1
MQARRKLSAGIIHCAKCIVSMAERAVGALQKVEAHLARTWIPRHPHGARVSPSLEALVRMQRLLACACVCIAFWFRPAPQRSRRVRRAQ